MPKNRRIVITRTEEESDGRGGGGASGEFPEFGAIFMSNSITKKECLKREIFGLPIQQAEFVKQVKAGMMLFLFEFESRELYGVFEAISDGAINIEPNSFRSTGKQFPAQVMFTEKWRCMPLKESEFRHAICENYFTAKKFNFGLSKAQVQRLLKLFSLKKVERSRPRKSERSLENSASRRGYGNRYAGDDDREFPVRDTSVRDRDGHRLTERYDFGLELDSTKGNEYSGDASGASRGFVDSGIHRSKDRVGHGFTTDNSFQKDNLTNFSTHSGVNDRRVPKNMRHPGSGWLDNECHEKDGIAEPSSWANHKERFDFKPEPVVPGQSSAPYGTSKDYYDPCEPGIMGAVTMKNSSRYLDSTGSASYTANSGYVPRENMLDGGGYVCDVLPLETIQPYLDEHISTVINKTSSSDLDYYIPMPSEYFEYQTNPGRVGVAGSESEYDPRDGHLRQFQFPDLLTSERDTENAKSFERPSYSRNSIFPSFADPLSSRDLSPNNETSGYQHREVSYSDDRVVRDSRIYPSFTNSPTSGYGADLYPETRTRNEVQAYQQRHEEFGSDAFDSKNRAIRMEDRRVDDAELERKRSRKSVFSRLALPIKEERAVESASPETESVDDVMEFLNDCHQHWMEQKRSKAPKGFGKQKVNPEGFGKQKKKKKHFSEVLENDSLLPFSKTTPDDDGLVDRDGSMEQSAQKLPFIDFKRRSKAQKSIGDPTEECKDSPEQHSAPQNKKRKLLRPKLESNSEKDRANNGNNPIENVLPSPSAT